jgi:hypothetical protein
VTSLRSRAAANPVHAGSSCSASSRFNRLRVYILSFRLHSERLDSQNDLALPTTCDVPAIRRFVNPAPSSPHSIAGDAHGPHASKQVHIAQSPLPSPPSHSRADCFTSLILHTNSELKWPS